MPDSPSHGAPPPDPTLSAIVESSDDAIIAKDLDGIIHAWSRGAERLYGYTTAEMKGRSLEVLIPAELRGELPGLLARVRTGERIEGFQTVRIAKDGRRLNVVLKIWPIRDAADRIVGASTIARDITALSRAQADLQGSEARWRAIVDAAVDAIIVIDAKGLIESFNPAAERLFGYSEADAIGRNVSVLMPPPFRDDHDGYLQNYLRTGEKKIIGIGREVIALRRDGTTFPVHLAVGEMTIGGERKFTGIIHDLSSRVRMETRLREQATMARLGEMAAVVAHEVKNPLAGIRGAIQVIGSHLQADSRDALVVKDIITRIDGLNSLMKDLLLFARPPQPKPMTLDAGMLIHDTVRLFSQDPAVKGVSVEIEGGAPPIAVDVDLMKIVIVNLLVNSAHAMQGQGTIRISICEADLVCRVAVHDSGPGIPADVLARIFTPFFTTKARGTGLGLPTAKRIVEAHGGTIAVECPPEGGTLVTIDLPAAASGAPA